MRARATVAAVAVLGGLVLGGCAENGGSAGGGDAAPPLEESRPSVEVPAGAKVLDRSVNRGENPSTAEFDSAPSFKPPIPDLYIRIKAEPAAEVRVNGTMLCQDVNSAASVDSSVPLTDGVGELVVRVRPPRGVRQGMECNLITAGSASTDPGKITRVTSELLAVERRHSAARGPW